MKKNLIFLLVSVMFLYFFSFPVSAEGETAFDPYNIIISDTELDTAIRELLEKPEGPLTLEDLGKITILDISGRGVTDISSVRYLSKLTFLICDDNPISDIHILQLLSNLTFLGLGKTEIEDIYSLGSLPSLTDLWLQNNKIADITPLRNLTNLKTLHIEYNYLDIAEGSETMAVINGLTANGCKIVYEPQNIPETEIPEMSIEDPVPEKVIHTNEAAIEADEMISALTETERNSAEAIENIINIAENNIKNTVKKEIYGDQVTLTADELADLAVLAYESSDAVTVAIESNNINVPREIRSGVTLVSAEKNLNVTFDINLSELPASVITIETPVALISIKTADIISPVNIEIKEIPKNAALEIVLLFWSAGVVAAVLSVWFVLVAVMKMKNKVKPLNMIMTCVLFIAFNGLSAVLMPSESGAEVTLNSSDKIEFTLSFPLNGGAVSSSINVKSAVVDENGNLAVSRYNPIKKLIETKINKSGTYKIITNVLKKVVFRDISAKPSDMREAIEFLCAKGFLNGISEKTFSPDEIMTRNEFLTALVTMTGRLDLNDKSKADNDWYFIVADAARKAGIAQGDGSGSLGGNRSVTNEEALVMAANTLVNIMNYKIPPNTENILALFIDKADISDWAVGGIALSAAVGLVTLRAGGKFMPAKYMTRGEAAILLYRIYNKLW